jgi:hypothetical protein
MFIFLRRRMLPAALLVALSGCASLSADHGFSAVSEIAKQRLGQTPLQPRSEQEHGEARAIVQKLLQEPLTADGALQIALLNNRSLQADYQELGIAKQTGCKPAVCRIPALASAAPAAAAISR